MKYLRMAFGFLTIIPIRATENIQPGDTGRAAGWFPLVGLAIGSLTAAAGFLFGRVFPPLPAAALTLVVWACLSGGLHLDGLADCCDALPGSATREKRLEILRDPRLGSFGGLGLGLYLILKFSLLAALPWGGGFAAYGLPILLAASFGRWLPIPAAFQPLARSEGMAADMARGVTYRIALLAALIPLLLAVAAGWRGMVALCSGLLVGLSIFRLTRSRLGGVTGDVMGLAVEAAEVAVLLVFVALPG